MAFPRMNPETAKNLNGGFTLVEKALQLLTRIDHSLLTLVGRQTDDQVDNALAEGLNGFGFTVGVAGITNNGWNGSNACEANPGRRALQFKNTTAAGGASITLGLGLRQPTAGAGIVLAPGDSWDGQISGKLWKGSVGCVASQAGGLLAMVEG